MADGPATAVAGLFLCGFTISPHLRCPGKRRLDLTVWRRLPDAFGAGEKSLGSLVHDAERAGLQPQVLVPMKLAGTAAQDDSQRSQKMTSHSGLIPCAWVLLDRGRREQLGRRYGDQKSDFRSCRSRRVLNNPFASPTDWEGPVRSRRDEATGCTGRNPAFFECPP